MPQSINRQEIDKFITERISRPRDLIAFFNECILEANNSPKLKAAQIRTAEGNYSRTRLRALADEWSADFPDLLEFTSILKSRTHSFKLSKILDSEIEDLCLSVVTSEQPPEVGISEAAMLVAESRSSPRDFKYNLFEIFYKTGLVGLKLESFETEQWFRDTGRTVSSAELAEETSAVVHKTFHRTLGIVNKR